MRVLCYTEWMIRASEIQIKWRRNHWGFYTNVSNSTLTPRKGIPVDFGRATDAFIVSHPQHTPEYTSQLTTVYWLLRSVLIYWIFVAFASKKLLNINCSMGAINILFSYFWVVGEVLLRYCDLKLSCDRHRYDRMTYQIFWLIHPIHFFYFWQRNYNRIIFLPVESLRLF